MPQYAVGYQKMLHFIKYLHYVQQCKKCMKSKGIIELFAHCKGGNLMFISGRGWAISTAKEGISGSTYNLVKSK